MYIVLSHKNIINQLDYELFIYKDTEFKVIQIRRFHEKARKTTLPSSLGGV